MKTNTITIVGMERTGLSIAMALKAGSQSFTVIGHDSEGKLLSDPAVTEALSRTEADLIRACEPADIVILAIPAVELQPTLKLIGDRLQDHTLVIDLTSLKQPGIQWANQYIRRGHYVGARPVFAASTFTDMRADNLAARPDLFKNSVFCVMPSVDTDPGAVETTVRFGQLLGAVPYFVDPQEYDQLSLGVETLPGASAAALMRSISKTTGWRDILRFADLPFAVGTLPLDYHPDDLAYQLLHDREATGHWLESLVQELEELQRLVREGEQELLSAYLISLNAARDKWLRDRSDNNWIEAESEQVDLPGLREHFLGGLMGRRKDSD
jgi:prephenate dehydrogenase